MYKFQIYLFVGILILIVLYVVGVILDSITTAKRNQTYQEYVETIRNQNSLLIEDINVSNKILELLLNKMCEDKKENDAYEEEEKMKKMLDELRKIVSSDCDFTVDINPVDFRVNISREMWESNAFSVVYSGMSESPFLDVDDQCEELQYALNLHMIKNILNIMNWMEENLDEIKQCICVCGKAVQF